MIVLLRRGSTEEEVLEVEREMERRGLSGGRITLGGQPALHVISGPTRRARRLLRLEQVDGLVPTSGPRLRAQGRRFYPYHVVVLGAACVLLFGALVMLAGFLPSGMGGAIDPRAAPAHIADPWYARATLEFVALFPPDSAWLAWLVLIAAGAAVLFLPVIDRGGRERGRAGIVAAGIVLALAWAWLTYAGGPA